MLRGLLSRVPRFLILTLAPILGLAGMANATTWQIGDMVTFSQYEWGAQTAQPPGSILDGPATLLDANYGSLYAATSGVLEVGIPGPSGFSLIFTNADSVLGYLPASGPAATLDTDLANPTSSASGIFGGDVTALRLNVDFYDAGILSYNSPFEFGDLVLHDLSAFPTLNGLTVRQLEHDDEIWLGGAPAPYSLSALSGLTEQINDAFGLGFVSQFAIDHLDAPVPEPGSDFLLGFGLIALAARRRRMARR